MTTPPAGSPDHPHDGQQARRVHNRTRWLRSLLLLGVPETTAVAEMDSDEQVQPPGPLADLIGEPVTLDVVVEMLRPKPMHLAAPRAEYAKVRAAIVTLGSQAGGTPVHVLISDEVPAGKVTWLALPASTMQCQQCDAERRALIRLLGR